MTSPTDRLALGMTSALALIAAAKHPAPIPVLVWMVALAAAILGLAAVATRWKVARLVHDFSPIAWIPLVFNLVGPVVENVNPARWDAIFASADVRLFGGLAESWRHALGRPDWLTDAASVAYVSFYALPVAMAAALLYRDRRVFDRFVFTIAVAFFLPCVGYLFFPTLGPRVPAEHAAEVLGGGAVSAGVRVFLGLVEQNVLDAFPSGHMAVTVTAFAMGWRLFPRWHAALVALCAAIVFATIYLSLHYIVDLVAGGLVAAMVPAASRRLWRLVSLETRTPGYAK